MITLIGYICGDIKTELAQKNMYHTSKSHVSIPLIEHIGISEVKDTGYLLLFLKSFWC